MARWDTLHPTADGCLHPAEWGALHQAQHITSRTRKEVWLRVVAGCSRYTTVYAARQGSYQQFRSLHTDAEKLAVLLCPCGGGVQDSLHVLRCTHNALEGLRRRVLEVTERCVLRWSNTTDQQVVHGPPSHGDYTYRKARPNVTARRSAKGRRKGPSKRKRTLSANEDAGWRAATDVQKLLTSLGSNCLDLPWELHAHVIGESAAHWGDVETTYAAVNGVVV